MAEWRGIQCAAKKLVITVEESRQVEIQKEISILQQLRHRNVIKFHATHAQNEDIYLIMDLAEKGDLAGAIKRKTLDWNTKPRIAHEIARGLEYIHDQGIVHSDLKSGNVLLTKYMEVKLCDFGVAQIRSVSLSKSGGRVGGTIRWMAPELFTVRPKYSAKSDIYALGMVMWEMAADCTPPFKSLANNTTVAAVVVRGEREIVPEETPDKYRQLLVQCWDQNPVKRPTAREVILHDPETDDSAAAESQESTDRSTVLHDAGGSEISLMSVTTTTASMSLSPRSSRTSVQRPGGSEEHGPPDVHALLARASDGNAEAQVALAVMFEDGIGVDKNDNASFRWYRLAAEQGSVEAQFKTGFYFLDGRGTKKNEQMAEGCSKMDAVSSETTTKK
ncbi:hypothetical protein BGZ73_004790 [Actinomortierella ambigua]|nr:hypothetical protein BGZ73_004790 [Actinomortierella ambigua]